jgi:hypothetical protein
MTTLFEQADERKARHLEVFEAELRKLGAERRRLEDEASAVRADIVRIARAAAAAGLTERRIAKAVGVTPAAAHKWLAPK